MTLSCREWRRGPGRSRGHGLISVTRQQFHAAIQFLSLWRQAVLRGHEGATLRSSLAVTTTTGGRGSTVQRTRSPTFLASRSWPVRRQRKQVAEVI